VATDSDIEKYQDILSDLRVDTNAIMHILPELTSAVNHTRMYVQANRRNIISIAAHQKVIEEYFKQVAFQSNSFAARIGSLEIRQKVDRILTALELVGTLYHQEQVMYHTRRAALEVGHLTEDLLPPGVLEDILQQAISQRYQVITQLEWYYQTLKVEPIWSENDNLLYRVKIPLIHNEQFLQYVIQTFPVPYQNSDVSAQLELQNHYGFNTQTGSLFLPHSCQGRDPAVCRPGPMYGPGSLQCPRGILNGSQQPKDFCTVTVTKGINDSIIQELDINTYVLTTWGEDIMERCAGEIENRFKLKADTYIMTVRASCSISGENWTIQGITEQNIHKHVIKDLIIVPQNINITSVLSSEQIPELFIEHPDVELSVIPNVPLDLKLPKTQPKHVHFISGHLSWATTAFVVLLIGIFIIAVGYYMYKTKCHRSGDAVPNLYVPVPAPSASVTFRSDPEELTASI
jgi:hypothetical protein